MVALFNFACDLFFRPPVCSQVAGQLAKLAQDASAAEGVSWGVKGTFPGRRDAGYTNGAGVDRCGGLIEECDLDQGTGSGLGVDKSGYVGGDVAAINVGP